MLRTRSLLTLAAAALIVSTAGCDAIAEKLGVDKVTVPLGSAGQNLAVSTTTAAIKTASVSRDGGELPNVFSVKSIEILPANVTFTPSTATKVAQSGVLRAALIVGSCAAAMTDVTITNNTVTALNPQDISIGTVNMTNFAALMQKLPAAQRPNVTTACTKDGLATELRKPSFSASLVAAVMSGDLNGIFGVQQSTFKLDF